MNLPDINVWLALYFDSHVHHAAAVTWMQSVGPHNCAFCRVTQLGFLRVATNRKVYPLDAISMIDAWRVYDDFLNNDRVVFADEPKDIDVAWRAFTQLRSFSTNVWADAYLAAFAKTADFELITFDKGFSQYKNLRHTMLS